MNKIALLSKKEREELFRETAHSMNVTEAIAEKDFWVVWVLDKIFRNEKLNKILLFKGGTSLSKVFDLIGRFSEDVDLILDWREVIKKNPQEKAKSKNQQMKLNKQINEKAQIYIENEVLPIVSEAVFPICKCNIDKKDGFTINVTYPASFNDKYLRSQILLEIGPLASWIPFNSFEISPYAAKYFPALFIQKTCRVNAILAERTFWEKATILHQEANRNKDKPFPSRYSRHYYDLAIMAKSEVKDKALKDLKLLESVVKFKQKFYPSSWAKYEDAKAGKLKLLPPEYRHKELKKDYTSMQNMIFNKNLDFDEIISILKSLEDEINSL